MMKGSPNNYGLRFLLEAARGSGDRLEMLVAACYRGLAGNVADRVIPLGFADGELVLGAESDEWLTAGRAKLENVRCSVNALLGAEVVKTICLRRSAPQAHRRPPNARAKKPTGTAAPSTEVRLAAEGIANPRVRRAFLTLAGRVAGMAKNRGDRDGTAR